MISAFLALRPAEGRLHDLVEYYRSARVIEGGLAYGLIRGELVLPRENPTDVGVVSRWESQESYGGWLAAPERERLLAGMTPLLAARDAIRGWTSEIAADLGDRPVDVTELYGSRIVDRPIVVVADHGV
ncbi:MAG TPA: antibiotic biosynthesis monooxygenase [Amycolatopsis sp.]|nr:antibiotic biosynthesis monooxygenase [Amycolatopsis sp.]